MHGNDCRWRKTLRRPVRPCCFLGDASVSQLLNVIQGTLPSMSLCIIQHWHYSSYPQLDDQLGVSPGTSHTGIDDLGSFLWVLPYSVLEIIQSRCRLPRTEISWSTRMESRNLAIQLGRSCLLDAGENQMENNSASSVIKAFSPILLAWRVLARQSEKGVI